MEEASSQRMEITTRLGVGGSEMQELIHDYILKYLASNDSWKKRFNVEVY